MPTVNEVLARFILFVCRIQGNKQVSLNQVKATMLLVELEEKLISEVRRTCPADQIRAAFIGDVETTISNAKILVNLDFTMEKWIEAVNEIKLHAFDSQGDMIDSYSKAIVTIMSK